MWMLALVACTRAPSTINPPTGRPWVDSGAELWACGQSPPTFERFALSNGSDAPDATGPTLLLDIELADPDGDLAPEVQLGLFWDSTLDGEVAADRVGVGFTSSVEGSPCTTTSASIRVPLDLETIADVIGAPFPYDSCIEFQANAVGNDALLTGDTAANTGLSDVIVVATPQQDGSDATIPCGVPDTAADTGS